MGLHFGGHTTANRDLTAIKRGELRHKSCDTPVTRRKEAPNGAKPPPLPLVSCSLTDAALLGQGADKRR